MLPVYVLVLSLILQVVAVVLAVRLMTITNQKFAWGLISAAILFMAIRRTVTLFGLTDFTLPELDTELVALAVSIFMLVGIYSMSPIVKRTRDMEKSLEENEDYIHQALKLVTRSEERYRVLFNSSNDAVFVYSVHKEDGKDYSMFTEVNEVACNMLGYSRTELLLMTLYDICPEKFWVPSGSNEDSVFETMLLDKAGTAIPVEVSTRHFVLQGEQTMLAFARDISERKAAEALSQKFGRVLDKSANELYIFDATSLSFIQVSQGALDNLGYSIDEIRRLHGYDLKNMSQDEFEEIIKPLRTGEKQQIRFLTEHHRKDGSKYKVEANLQLLTQETPPVFVGVITDVTERLRVETKIREWQSEFAHASRLATVGSFSTELAHELNQPLSAIMNYVRGTLRRYNNGGLNENDLPMLLEKINDQADRATRIMQRLRDFVHTEHEACSDVDINQLIHKVMDFMQVDIQQSAVEVDLQLARELPCICVEPLRLEQVLVNLVKNSLQALEDQPVKRLVIRTQYDQASLLHVSVCDTGEGISQVNIERVLEPFATTRAEGIGLGLPISRSIIESYGGRLWIESAEAGHETEFCFSLPVEEVASARSA